MLDTKLSAHKNRQERRAEKAKARSVINLQPGAQLTVVPITLTWTDHLGKSYATRVLISQSGVITFETTNEKLPNCHLFAAQALLAPAEASDTFSGVEESAAKLIDLSEHFYPYLTQ